MNDNGSDKLSGCGGCDHNGTPSDGGLGNGIGKLFGGGGFSSGSEKLW